MRVAQRVQRVRAQNEVLLVPARLGAVVDDDVVDHLGGCNCATGSSHGRGIALDRQQVLPGRPARGLGSRFQAWYSCASSRQTRAAAGPQTLNRQNALETQLFPASPESGTNRVSCWYRPEDFRRDRWPKAGNRHGH